MARINCAHPIHRIPYLLGKSWDYKSMVLLGPTIDEWCQPYHDEMKVKERDQIHKQLAEV